MFQKDCSPASEVLKKNGDEQEKFWRGTANMPTTRERLMNEMVQASKDGKKQQKWWRRMTEVEKK